MHCRWFGNTGHNTATYKEPSSDGQNASISTHGVSENPTPNSTVPESRKKKQAINMKLVYVISFDLAYAMNNCVD